jgi:replicative DNA helicase
MSRDNVTPLREPGTLPPHNPDAEQALLGAFLCDNRQLEVVADFLKAEHFANGFHARIFEETQKLFDRGQITNPVTLKAIFDQDPALASCGGARYLGQLVSAGAMLLHIEDYAHVIYDLWQRRQLIDHAQDVLRAAYNADSSDPASAQIERAEAQLYRLAESGGAGCGFRSLTDATGRALEIAEAAHKRGTRIVGVTTGFLDLDKLLGGLHRSDLVILAGRPAMSKTAFATNVAVNLARNGDTVAFFSLEMADEQLGSRVLGTESGIRSDWVRRGDLNQQHFDRLVEARRQLAELPLFIDGTSALTVPGLRARARRLKRRHSLALIVIDYLQLLLPSRSDGTQGNRREQNRAQEVAEITRGLKSLAKELDVPVVALSQLNRDVEARDNKRPLLSDLRESGSIEQDADVVIFIFREEYYLKPAEPSVGDTRKHTEWNDKMTAARNKAELIVAKHRHGQTGTVRLHFDDTTTRFSDLASSELSNGGW